MKNVSPSISLLVRPLRKLTSSFGLYIWAIVLTPLGLAVILYINFQLLFQQGRESTLEMCHSNMAVASAKFNSFMLKAQSLLNEYSRITDVMLFDGCPASEIRKKMLEIDTKHRKISDGSFVSLYGYVNNVWLDTGPWRPDETYVPTNRPWYLAAIKGQGKTMLVPPYVDADTGEIVISLVTMLSDKKSVVGVDHFFNDVATMHEPHKHRGDSLVEPVSESFLLDNEFNIIIEKDTLKKYPRVHLVSSQVKKIMQSANSGEVVPDTVYLNGIACTIFHTELMDGWIGLTIIRHDKLRANVIAKLKTHMVISVLITFLVWISLSICFYLLQYAKKKSEQAERSRSSFFASVSHDIRTPLNSIIGFSQLLKDGNVRPTEEKEYLNDIIISGNILMQLINDILDLSKMDAEKIEYHYELHDFRLIAKETMAIFTSLAKGKGNELEMQIDPGMPLVKIDMQRIRQTLFNLVGNAVKFTSGGKITVIGSFEKTDDAFGSLTFEVKDTGIGIPKSYLKKIFDPFVQVNGGGKGTGLGLPICNRLVSQMGGKMTVESEEGKGSSFIVKVNNVEYSHVGQTDGKESSAAEISQSPVAIGQKKLRLLLVDDVILNLKVLSRLLANVFKAECVLAASGAEAMEQISKEHFDAVLTDYQMPGMSGEDLLNKIRSDESLNDLRVFVISADVNLLNVWGGKGFSGLLLKPITLDGLEKFVCRYFS